MLNEDYRDILCIFLAREVRFLIIGAYALGAYGYPRATGDFDLWVDTSIENAGRIYDALVEFGAPVSQLTKTTFREMGIVYQIGVAPRRIDLITAIDGVDFTEAYLRRTSITVESLDLPFISKEDLIKNKRSSGRLKDRVDADTLEGIKG